MAEQAIEQPVFCVVDPSLKDFIGHHFAYDDAVARAAAAAGFRAVTLAHRDVSEVIAGRTEVVRCFRRDIWGDDVLANHAVAKYLPARLRAAANNWRAGRDFGADLNAGLCGRHLPPGSILFAHMIFRDQLPALASFVAEQPAAGPLQVILLLRYQPEFYDNHRCARAFRQLERAATAGHRVRLASDSARLARELSLLTSLPIEVMPIPLTAGLDAVPPPRSPDAPLRFVSLGNARDEKGYLEILDAIRMLRETGELEGLEFVLQSNDAAADVRIAIECFSADCPAGVTLLRHSLSPEEYNALLLSADAVLVPYWREIYRDRTSGVFLESVAAGKIVVTTRDTWMSDELERYGSGVLVDDHDPASIASAIRAVRDGRGRMAGLAEAGRSACLVHHNPAALVRQAAEGPPPRPSPGGPVRRVAMFYPWDDLLDLRSGASIRCNLLARTLSPLVEEIRVLQGGSRPARPGQAKFVKAKLALRSLLFGRLLTKPARSRDVSREYVMRAGNVRVEQVPLRLRQHLARRLFRLPFRVLLGRGFGQELMVWYFLERWLDPIFRARSREMVAWADVVLLEYPFWARIVAPSCRVHRRQLIITNHDVLAQQVTASRLLRALVSRLENGGLASGDHAVCVSETDRAWFARSGIAAHVIPNPVDLDRLAGQAPDDPLETLREQYNIMLPPGPVCLFVGSKFGPNNEAASRIKEIAAHLPRGAGPVAFTIAGGCAEPGHGPNWIALGMVEDGALALLYHLARLVLIPLRDGTGSSVKTVEALLAGKPVLGTSMAFRGLNLRSGRDCVRQDDLTRWPAQIVDLLASPEQLCAMGAAARRAGEVYDYRLVFQAYLPLLGLARASPAGADDIGDS